MFPPVLAIGILTVNENVGNLLVLTKPPLALTLTGLETLCPKKA